MVGKVYQNMTKVCGRKVMAKTKRGAENYLAIEMNNF